MNHVSSRFLIALALGVLASLLTPPALAQRSTPLQLLHPAGVLNDNFGAAVAIDADTIIIGAPADEVGFSAGQGSAHVYRWTGSGWTLEATLTAADAAPFDNFGISVALSGDTAIVGAYLDDVGSQAEQGSAYVFVRSGTTWTQQAKLTASSAAPGDLFGASVAISADTAVVGAYLADVNVPDQGAAYVFTRTGSTWTQQARLIAPDGQTGDLVGCSVAVAGDTVLVGAALDDVGTSTDQGSVYVFARAGSTWTQQARLNAVGGAPGDQFGFSLALSGDTALIGAHLVDVGINANQGSAYVFARSGSTWTQQAQLFSAGGASVDLFGFSVALSGDTALVGARLVNVGPNSNQGSAYAFTRSGTAWTQQAQLTATDGRADDNFGYSVALSGDTALVGALFDDVAPDFDVGSAWVFSRIGSTWIGPDLKLFAPGSTSGDFVGSSVAISGDTAILGAYSDNVGPNLDQGSAYIFVRSGTIWTQQAQLFASPAGQGDFFGYSVAISGDTAVVGTPLDDVGSNSNQGSAYVFTRSGATWTQQAQLTASNGAADDEFGFAVSISGETVLVGAPYDDVNANSNQGSAYIFTRSGATWTQQAQLTAANGSSSDGFGVAVALSGDTAIVGASFDDVGANADQGSAYAFIRSGTTWTQQAQFTAADAAALDTFGASVAIDADTAVVGAPGDDVGTNPNQGSAYIYARSGATWTQQAKLTASNGAATDSFGTAVAISQDTVIVGAPDDDVGANSNQGTAFLFTRTGSSWTQQFQLVAPDGATTDAFGFAVAISGDTTIAGAYGDDISASNQGSAWAFDAATNDFSVASNDATGALFASLAAALLPAGSGQQISATEAAWRAISSPNTLGRSLSLRSTGDLRYPSSASLELGGSSTLSADPGHSIDVFGQLRLSSSSSADITADVFTLGSRGILTARTGSSLTINAQSVKLDGQTRLEQGAALTFAGGVTAIGPTTANLNSTVTAGGTFINIDTFTLSSGIFAGPLFSNRAAFNIFGTSAVFGSLTNDAITTIRSGSLVVFGSLTNNGTIVGTVCPNCLGSPSNLDVLGDLVLGPAANLTMPFDASLVRIGGDLDNAINSSTRLHLSLATLQMEGTGAEQTLEVMSTDIGRNALGLDRTASGHYPIGTLHIGPSPSTIRLVDSHDNDALGQSQAEAVYVDTLRIDAGSRLINESNIIYYNTLIADGVVDVPENLRSLTCRAELDGVPGVDLGDFLAFFNCYDAEAPCGDVDGIPGTDLGDFLTFFNAYDSLCL